MKITKKIIKISAFIFIVCLISLSCTQGPIDATGEIQQAKKGFMEAFNSGDANALAMMYTKDGKLYVPNSEIIKGQEGIEKFWSKVFGMGLKKCLLETVSAEKIGTYAVEEGKYTLSVDGDVVVDQGKYLVSWNKEGGEWKIDIDIWNSNNPLPPIRARLNDTIWIVNYLVKADKVEQFKDFNFNYLEPAAKEKFLEARNTVRLLKPVGPNKDGNYTYTYIMDPVVHPTYDMMIPLKEKYGEEKAQEYLKMFQECIIGDYKASAVIQTQW